jgi:hypothetical protein
MVEAKSIPKYNVRNWKCGVRGTFAGHKLQDFLKVQDELFGIYAGCSEDLLSRCSQKIARFRYVHTLLGVIGTTQMLPHIDPCELKHRTQGHTETTISGDTPNNWRERHVYNAV